MKIIRTGVKLLSLLGLAGLVAGFWTSRSHDPALFPPTGPADCVTIHVSDTGWHTGVIIAADDLNNAAANLPTDAILRQAVPLYGGATHFEFGWGDREFYMSGTNESGRAAKALLWPGDAVMHMVGLDREPAAFFNAGALTEINISRAGLNGLVAGIGDSFSPTPEGPRILGTGLYGVSAFFPAKGKFHLASTCNGWTADMLARAGLPHLPVLATHSGPLLWHIRKFAAPDAKAVCQMPAN